MSPDVNYFAKHKMKFLSILMKKKVKFGIESAWASISCDMPLDNVDTLQTATP